MFRPTQFGTLAAMPIVVVALVLGICIGIAASAARGTRRGAVSRSPAAEVGLIGVAVTALGPHGVVHVDYEDWSATTDGASVAAGEPVRVLGRCGLRLRVRRAAGGGAATDKAVRDARNR
jgi:membrane-bound ClpP family serine protease